MMKKKQWILLIIAACVLLGGVFLINRDIMHWETAFGCSFKLMPDKYPEDVYHLDMEAVTLKPGTYTLTLNGDLGAGNGARSAVKVDDAEGEVLLESVLDGGEENKFEFSVGDRIRQIRIHIFYDPGSDVINIKKVKISTESVLYKESLIRHIAVTAFFFLLWAFLSFRLIFPEQYRKCFPKLAKPETEVSILLLVLLTVISCIPLYNSGWFCDGDDLYYHLGRIRGISVSLREGYIPARIILDCVEDYGYGSGFYYPDFFLQIPALLLLLGFSYWSSYRIFVFLCTFFSLCSIYGCVKKISGKLSAARLSAVLYAFAAYRLIDIFYRAAVGEFQSFIFMPMIILGLYEIYEGHPEKWLYFALGFAGLLLSHMISLAICGVFTLAFVLIRFRKTFGDRKVFAALVKSVLLTLALGAFFILPMMEQAATVELKVNGIFSGTVTRSNIISFKDIFLLFDSWHTKDGQRNAYPGIIFLIIPALRLIFVRKRSMKIVIADTLTLFGVAALIMSTNAFPWRRMIHVLYRIQISSRIFIVATVCLSISCAIYADLISSSKWFAAAVVLGAAACGLPIIIETCENRMFSIDEYLYRANLRTVAGGEYLPANFDRDYPEENKDNVLSNTADYEITRYKRQGLTFTFSYEVKDGGEDVYFNVPLIMYTGYRAELTTADGAVTELQPEADDIGLVRVNTGGVDAGTICVHYEKTTIQIVSEIISLSALAFIIVVKLYGKKESRL